MRGTVQLASTLRSQIELALLFRRIATVELDVDVGTVDEWWWTGPTPRFGAIAHRLGAPELVGRAERAGVRAAGRAAD